MNVGQGKDADWAGRLKRTAIDKRPVTGPVAVGSLGLAGDEQVDKPGHGGCDQAVYVYAREDLDWWVERLGRELLYGTFGENITTTGLDVSGSLIGEIWRLGTSVVQITSMRIPCRTRSESACSAEPRPTREARHRGAPGPPADRGR